MPPALRRLWCALCAVCCVLCAVVGCSPREPVVKIGFAAPLTGDQASPGQDLLKGAQLAIVQAEAAGPVLPGYRLELVALDDQRSPTQAVAVAKKLVADRDVVAVVGHLNSSCTMPASAVYHQGRLLQVSPVSSNPQISRQGFDTFYRTCATDDLQGPAAARFAVTELGARRVAILDDMTTYGRGLANEFEKELAALGATVLLHEGLTQGDKDFTPVLTKIKSLEPDLLYFAGMFPEAALLIKQRRDLGVGGHFLGGDGLYDPILIRLATPEAAEGVYATTIGADIRQVPTAQEFVRAYEAAYGTVGAYSAYGYEAARVVLWALRQAGRKDREAVLAAMTTLTDSPGVFGLQRFDERGDSRLRDVGLFTVKGGRFVFLKTVSVE
ncbi:MAG: branched-chain amino acid ABC transporter substrate-binding protein [Candidatus Omnitrophica bacterium]|nr:branched-chain amino acid ABC transporter substrate-binding protein [Candidatus Omnitrophota bacterium]